MTPSLRITSRIMTPSLRITSPVVSKSERSFSRFRSWPINGDVFRQRLRGFWKDVRRRRPIELLMKKRLIHIGEVLNNFIFVEQRIDRLKAFYIRPIKSDKCPAKQKRPKRDSNDYASLSHSNSPSIAAPRLSLAAGSLPKFSLSSNGR